VTIRVYYEAWQLECCGDPFQVGDEVSWRLVASDLPFDLRELVGSEVEEPQWTEEHHGDGDGVAATRARVIGIQVLVCEHTIDPNTRWAERVPGTGRLIPVRYANGHDPGDGEFEGHVVDLDPFTP
jgi:hypothetical protein